MKKRSTLTGVLDVLDGEQRRAGGDRARPAARRPCPRRGWARASGPRARRAQRARLQILALQVALLLQRAQVIVHPVRRSDAEVQADLAQRRRVAALANGLRDEVEDLALAIREGARACRREPTSTSPCFASAGVTEHTYRTERMCRVKQFRQFESEARGP
jgi:hypothetical protein